MEPFRACLPPSGEPRSVVLRDLMVIVALRCGYDARTRCVCLFSVFCSFPLLRDFGCARIRLKLVQMSSLIFVSDGYISCLFLVHFVGSSALRTTKLGDSGRKPKDYPSPARDSLCFGPMGVT